MLNRPIFRLVQQSIEEWMQYDPFLYASSLAFFTIFSLAPLVVIIVDIVGMFFSQQIVTIAIYRVVSSVAGAELAQFVVELIPETSNYSSGGLVALIGTLVLLYGASIAFARLQIALDAMLGIRPKTTTGAKNVINKAKGRIFAALVVIGLGLYLIVGLFIAVIWFALPKNVVGNLLGDYSQVLLTLISVLVSPLIFMIPFALIYKFLPQAHIRWRDVWPGAALSATLFWIGGFFIGLYLAFSGITSVYGAAGSLVAFLIWIFYSAMIFLYGATFIKTYADIFGQSIIPNENMVFLNPGLSSNVLTSVEQDKPVSDEAVERT